MRTAPSSSRIPPQPSTASPIGLSFEFEPSGEQLLAISEIVAYSVMDSVRQIGANRKLVSLNFAYWTSRSPAMHGLSPAQKKDKLGKIREV